MVYYVVRNWVNHRKRGTVMEYVSHSAEETEAFGEALAARLRPGDVVAYRGGLGMGKTAFTRGLARGLGCTGRVSSPTFTIVNEYDGPLPLFHLTCTAWAGRRSCSASAGRTTWTGAAYARWSGASWRRARCRMVRFK